MNDLLRRHAALAKVQAKYDGRPIDFQTVDCLRMLRSHLVAMGHKHVPKLPSYRSAAEARRALKAVGHDSLESLLDSLLPRIVPAMRLPGDVVLFAGTRGLDAVTLCVGHKVWGWSEQNRLREPVNIIPGPMKAAYRA